jgi:transcriptional regulator with XRE-family HTH domain
MEEIIFPNKIRLLRKMAGLHMQDLADRLGISLSAVSKIEKGYRKIDQEQMRIVADFLGCSMGDIFVSEDDADAMSEWKSEIDRRVEENKSNGLKIFGAGLRYLRGIKDMTLMDVADAAGLTLSVYHRIEVGQREITESELFNISRALGMTIKEVLTRIYDLKNDGSLDRLMSVGAVDPIAKIGDVLRTSESVYTPEGVVKFQKVLKYSRTSPDGVVTIDDSAKDYVVYPMSEKPGDGIYAIELASRRLGNVIPLRSLLFIDPNQPVKGGDIAAQVISEKNGKTQIKLMCVREDSDGRFYGVEYNPDAKVRLSPKDLSRLHRVVIVSMG